MMHCEKKIFIRKYLVEYITLENFELPSASIKRGFAIFGSNVVRNKLSIFPTSAPVLRV